MRKCKQLLLVGFAALSLSLVCPNILPGTGITNVEAAVKINKKKLTLTKGKSATLKITGTKKKIKWSSSKKAVATVSSKGKVTAKKKGNATITAKVDKKKYTCKVTVNEPVNEQVDNSVKCIPDKPATFSFNNNVVHISSFEAKFDSYKEFDDYSKPITDPDYYMPYTYSIKISGTAPKEYAGRIIYIYLAPSSNGVTVDIRGIMTNALECKILNDGSFMSTSYMKSPHKLDKLNLKYYSFSTIDE